MSDLDLDAIRERVYGPSDHEMSVDLRALVDEVARLQGELVEARAAKERPMPSAVERARELLAGISRAPWGVYRQVEGDHKTIVGYGVTYNPADAFDCSSLTCGHLAEPDAEFIAAAPTLVLELVQEVEEAREILRELVYTWILGTDCYKHLPDEPVKRARAVLGKDSDS